MRIGLVIIGFFIAQIYCYAQNIAVVSDSIKASQKADSLTSRNLLIANDLPRLTDVQNYKVKIKIGSYVKPACRNRRMFTTVDVQEKGDSLIYKLVLKKRTLQAIRDCRSDSIDKAFMAVHEELITYPENKKIYFDVPKVFQVNYQFREIVEEAEMFSDRLIPWQYYDLLPKGKLFILRFKIRNNEDQLVYQLLPGKIINHNCNPIQAVGRIKQRTVNNKPYFEVLDLQTNNSLNTCPENESKESFVYLETDIFPYVSKQQGVLLLVDYDMLAKYRIWKLGKEKQAIPAN